MKKIKKTRWFKDGDIPVYEGFYEVKLLGKITKVHWDSFARQWKLIMKNSENNQMIIWIRCGLIWRGLAEKPE